MEISPITHKFVAVLNKKIPVYALMNALGHASIGIGAGYSNRSNLRIGNYVDANNGIHPHISDNPFIVLRADNSNQIRQLRFAAIAEDVEFSDFTSSMTEGTYVDQQLRTKEILEANLDYYAIVLFGEIERINVLTKKFSLWR